MLPLADWITGTNPVSIKVTAFCPARASPADAGRVDNVRSCAHLCGMRTTIDLPEPLFKSLKLLTLQKGVSLKTFITQALEAALQAPAAAGTGGRGHEDG